MGKNKKKYKIKNWPDYNESLKQRGTIEVWINDDILDKWKALPSGRPGAQPVYSDLAIQIVLQVGKVFHQKLRQTEGLLENVFRLMKVKLSVPDYSTVSRRSANLNVLLTKEAKKKGEKLIVVIDSTGLKVYGEGEWKVRQHGVSKRRTWRKAHLMVANGEIRAAELTKNNIADCDVFENLLNQEKGKIDTVAGDGGYDRGKVYQACLKRKIKNILIPPQENAKIKLHGNLNSEPHPRDENLRQIRKTTRKRWKEESGYHIRSLAETMMFRFKAILGDKLNARKLENQVTEFLTSVSIMNKITSLGMPDSYVVI
ncbi:hypothetical protein AUJ84_00555 [Candidatus Pacearchaeota archaeon CG1_02_32_132]|nr:MAG: hypothetical protein AUJ84_00555 [Candidatus Pacearchaeota archaeon CG1_02_32_132]